MISNIIFYLIIILALLYVLYKLINVIKGRNTCSCSSVKQCSNNKIAKVKLSKQDKNKIKLIVKDIRKN